MVVKGKISNEYRFAFRAGELAEIPAEVLEQLRAEYPKEEGMWAVKAKKPVKVDD